MRSRPARFLVRDPEGKPAAGVWLCTKPGKYPRPFACTDEKGIIENRMPLGPTKLYVETKDRKNPILVGTLGGDTELVIELPTSLRR